MHIFVVFIFLFILLLLELFYFKLADRHNIIDRPNHRSSHTKITIRGGGIIFPMGLLLVSVYLGNEYAYFMVGLILISLISFLDDIKPVGKRIRITIHIVAVALLFYQLGLFSQQVYWILFGLVFVIGTINAINFMDGINGITGGYALVTLLTLYYVNDRVTVFTNGNYILATICSLLVFNFFNFRKKARCFAGDVGSVSIAFIIAFFLLQLILTTYNLSYVLLLLVYGLDSSTTILFRAIRKENIFEAHRSHLYQFLSNERKIPQLLVASGYALIQLMVNIILVNFSSQSLVVIIIGLVLSVILFILLRFKVEGFNYLTRYRKIINT